MTRLSSRDFAADPEQPGAGSVMVDPAVTAELSDLLADMDESERRTEARIARFQGWIDWLATPVGMTVLAVFWCVVLSLALWAKGQYGGGR